MEAIRVHEHGGPEVLRLEELPTPTPGPGEAVVRLDASGVNFFDIRQRTGDYKSQLPITLGNEGAGTVDAIGPDGNGFAVGDRVAWQMQQGSYATHAIVPVEALVPLPDDISTPAAASLMLQGLTAQVLACSAYPLQEGDTCLVHSAAGGVGGLLTQIAKLRGARVIATVSKAAKVDRAIAVGADEVIVYTEADFAAEVRRRTGGRGADVAYDGVGQETFLGSLKALKPLGYLVSYGQSSGAVAPFDTHHLAVDGGRFLTRTTIGQYVTDRNELLVRSAELFDWVATGKLRLHIGGTFALADAGLAQEAMSSRRTEGKLLLQIG
jgi:NADPH:quinone reductase